MKNSTYLYGRKFKAKDIAKMPYAEAIEYKIGCSQRLLESLTEATTSTTDWVRINKVGKAIKFNQYLLNEALGKDEDVS